MDEILTIKEQIKSSLPSIQRNAVRFEIQAAVTKVKPTDDKVPASIEFLVDNDYQVDVFYQAQDIHYGNELTHFKTNVLKSLACVENVETASWNYIWKSLEFNGCFWLPLSGTKELRVRLTIGSKVGNGTINLDSSTGITAISMTDENDESQNKEVISLVYSTQKGTQFDIEFRTGDPHYTPGTGTDVQFLDGSGQSPYVYETLKEYNPSELGQRSVAVKETIKSSIMLQINGLEDSSNFFMCDNTNEGTYSDATRKLTTAFSNCRVFVTDKIGLPFALTIRLVTPSSKKLNWYLEKVILQCVGDENNTLTFPCFQWLTTGDIKTIAFPKAYVPLDWSQSEYEYVDTLRNLAQTRKSEIEKAASRYQWTKMKGKPSVLRGTRFGAYDLVPFNEQFDDYKTKDFSFNIVAGRDVLMGCLKKARTNKMILSDSQSYNENKSEKIESIESMEDYADILNSIKDTPMFSTKNVPIYEDDIWKSDDFFGWTFLYGTNPMHLKRCNDFPQNIYDAISGNILSKATDAKKYCDNGEIYCVDYLELQNIEFNPVYRKYSIPCVCYFYANGTTFVPIAIGLMLNRESKKLEIFTREDTPDQWLFAKIAVHNADAQFHQISDHFLNTHAVCETFSIALNRAVSRAHPIYRVLQPYLKYTIPINVLARKSLISPGGVIEALTSVGTKLDDLLKTMYKNWDFSQTDLPARLSANGFETIQNRDGSFECIAKSELNDFPYRDDGLQVWNEMFKFVGNYLNIYYKNDNQVKKDEELKNWIEELNIGNPREETPREETPREGNPCEDDTKMFKMPKTVGELQMLLTTIMWTTSCQHSVVNFNQYRMYAHIPLKPLALYGQPPKEKSQINKEFIRHSLPNLEMTVLQIVSTNLLSKFADNEEYLTSERYIEMIGNEALGCLKEYQTNLSNLSKDILKNDKRRSKGEKYAYTLLVPSEIPNSIAI